MDTRKIVFQQQLSAGKRKLVCSSSSSSCSSLGLACAPSGAVRENEKREREECWSAGCFAGVSAQVKAVSTRVLVCVLAPRRHPVQTRLRKNSILSFMRLKNEQPRGIVSYPPLPLFVVFSRMATTEPGLVFGWWSCGLSCERMPCLCPNTEAVFDSPSIRETRPQNRDARKCNGQSPQLVTPSISLCRVLK